MGVSSGSDVEVWEIKFRLPGFVGVRFGRWGAGLGLGFRLIKRFKF